MAWMHRLEGGCMRPLLRNGEVLAIRPIRPEEVSLGDIVLYRVGQKRLLHRVWRKDGKSFWMKDDTGSVALHRIRKASILGVLDARRPLSGGWIGLIYSGLNTLLFTAARPLKRLIASSFSQAAYRNK